MKKTKDFTKLIEWLDDRYNIMTYSKREADKIYYQGAIQALTMLGLHTSRTAQGTHRIYES